MRQSKAHKAASISPNHDRATMAKRGLQPASHCATISTFGTEDEYWKWRYEIWASSGVTTR